MPDETEEYGPASATQPSEMGAGLRLRATVDVPAGAFVFDWLPQDGSKAAVARWLVQPCGFRLANFYAVEFVSADGKAKNRSYSAWPSSIGSLLRTVRKMHPLADEPVQIGLLTDIDLGIAKAGKWLPLQLGHEKLAWRWLAKEVLAFARLIESLPPEADARELGPKLLHLVAANILGVAPAIKPEAAPSPPGLLNLSVTFNRVEYFTEFVWMEPGQSVPRAVGRVRTLPRGELKWDLEKNGTTESTVSSSHLNSIRAALGDWIERLPTDRQTFAGFWVDAPLPGQKPKKEAENPFGPDESPMDWIEGNLKGMAEAGRMRFSPMGPMFDSLDQGAAGDFERYVRKMSRKGEKFAEEEAKLREKMAKLAAERARREEEKKQARMLEASKKRAALVAAQKTPAPQAAPKQAPLPPVEARIELPSLTFQDTAFPLENLQGFLLREKAALWWVSNQSDDLLCLPSCRIERLEYQVRSALRVLGPLRGRALLSDEVGLGKTIEAGLVIKELLTRGMVKRFLVLTVPSLVDQWEEELSDKFNLTVATTNRSIARSDPERFWRENAGIVASLHTLKQAAHLEVARQTPWDILVVDEAHYLRNRESQAWQAVNSLPRQFLLLLTATPVQNSLEELYNLVTLLQPGQLPSPKEFRSRFVDPKRPRQPREPEELRRLLGQVMIRNTRANSGIQLPPRRAETVMFEPEAQEGVFWTQWEAEFRAGLAQLKASESSLWGRLVLQAAGSSPAAWRSVLEKFPDRQAARVWREQAPLEASWRKKCDLLLPLTRMENGAVIFTQFLETQAALADFLRSAGVDTFVVNGSTPAPERQPITEQFRKQGGALLLTHSGTEGRNLQFCHVLANFDLPWNPMEIEQRIGRLHRLGQQHPVRIYNFVQAGTLQEHLLDILQEKLNLFELVVGETGLVLGERFGSDDFAEEILRRWRDNEGRVAEAMAGLGTELAAARDEYSEVKKLDETLFAKDYESL